MLSADPETLRGSPSIPSVAGALRAIDPDLPAKLIPAEARPPLASIGSRLPRILTSFGFECRLADEDPTVDLGLSVMRENGGGRALAELDAIPGESALLARDERWARIRAFARSWSDPASPLAPWVPFLFMEFDANAADERPPVPSIFVALDAPLEVGQDRDAADERGPIAAVREASRCLAGHALGPELDSTVVGAFRALPPQAWVMHTAVMLGREAAGVRLSVSLPGPMVAGFLRQLGADRGAAEAAEDLLRPFGAHADPAQVDFDLVPGVGPRLGFGLQPRSEAEWPDLLDRLVEAGWCCPSKREALLAWPGGRRATLDGADHVLHRHLSHVKLATRPEQPPIAKAYLGVTPLRVEATGRGASR